MHRQSLGEMADWDLRTQVLVGIFNSARTLVWQNTKDAAEKNPKNRPEPLLPPGVELDDENRQVEKFGNAHMTIEEANEWLGW